MVTRNTATAPNESDHPGPWPPGAPEPTALTRFWDAADALPELATALTDWGRRLGPEFDLVRPFLRLAPSGASRADPDEREHEVDAPALAGAVADALGLRREPARDPAPRAAHVGPLTGAAGARYTCFLVLTGTVAAARALAPHLGTGGDGPPLLLCTSRVVAADPALRRDGRGAVPLAAAVAAAGPGRLRPVSPLEAALAWAAQVARPRAGDWQPRNALWHGGGAWSVTFAGKTALLGDRIGLWYVARLIQAKRRHIRAAELRDVVRGRASPAPYRGDTAADDERVSRELADEIARARGDHDWARVERLQDQFHAIVGRAHAHRGPGRRGRRLGDESTSLRTSVKNAIDHVIGALERPLPELARHLHASIETGAELRYAPVPDVEWEV
ncbi:hypothetical protein GobsT_51640 [Gemmata obscuriglobus]|uniref:Uncharacterized protein n=1 Tax=Gemmata obscuriglobus TaxID=114 RepID=A0A2Z3H040_9BACT|nr:hypothetical protein [Gemmata obscuriglobus]AWM36956.1 hypothetical protein C1280_07940 [Gemmata obscuriglobus]QEG30359.1 hypothetical protein GobsT_51640 [Gemmata obscuriglobus]VTS09683.1 Uncharacterized protein OS=Rhodopirellula sallentina SM41 GN=RSSM_01779 PE=4 SV=1 [Gemmata obscuriglobus UQM 2246]